MIIDDLEVDIKFSWEDVCNYCNLKVFSQTLKVYMHFILGLLFQLPSRKFASSPRHPEERLLLSGGKVFHLPQGEKVTKVVKFQVKQRPCAAFLGVDLGWFGGGRSLEVVFILVWRLEEEVV